MKKSTLLLVATLMPPAFAVARDEDARQFIATDTDVDDCQSYVHLLCDGDAGQYATHRRRIFGIRPQWAFICETAER